MNLNNLTSLARLSVCSLLLFSLPIQATNFKTQPATRPTPLSNHTSLRRPLDGVENKPTHNTPGATPLSAETLKALRAPTGEHVYQIKPRDARPTDSSYSSVIQNALDTAGAAGGGTVSITDPGTYLLTATGQSQAQRFCFRFRYSNLKLFIGSGVILQLADNQQTDELPPINIVLLSGGIQNITIEGGGRITGNTHGQPWSRGYTQDAYGVIIFGEGSLRNIMLRNLFLDDHFANSIDLNGNASATNKQIRIENITSDMVGEGPQVVYGDDVWLVNVLSNNSNRVMRGDAIELSTCTNFHVIGCTARDSTEGSSFDIFGCKRGVIENFIAEGSRFGVSIHSFGTVPDPEDTVLKGGVISFPAEYGYQVLGVELVAPTLRNISVSDVIVKGNSMTNGVQAFTTSSVPSGPVVIESCQIANCFYGIFVATLANLSIRDCNVYNNRTGIEMQPQNDAVSPAQTANLHISNVVARNNSEWGIHISQAGHVGNEATGTISNCTLDDNGLGAFFQDETGRTEGKLHIESITPSTATITTSVGYYWGLRSVIFDGNMLAKMRGGSRGQILSIRFQRNTTVANIDEGNISLNGPVGAQTFQAGSRLVLQYDETNGVWYELSRQGKTGNQIQS
jgi:hypothetical protein